MSTPIDSAAFEVALLNTERLRIIGLVVITSTFVITGAIRIYLFGSHLSHIGVYGCVVFISYELLVLRTVNRAIKLQSRIPRMFWTQNIVVEMSLPAFALAFLASSHIPAD